MANSKNESMEVWETRYPVEFVAYELVPDSGGAGEHRGGLGTERRFRVLRKTRISGISDHHFIDSIYFRDPDGYVVELTAKRDNHNDMTDAAKNSARAKLDRWQQAKAKPWPSPSPFPSPEHEEKS